MVLYKYNRFCNHTVMRELGLNTVLSQTNEHKFSMSINRFETCHSMKWISVAKAARVSLLITTVYQTCFREKGGACMYEIPVCAL